jgi:CheY-like chemotaxis protein
MTVTSAKIRTAEAEPSENALGSANLLVVEDNRHAMRLITTVLRSMGIRNVVAANNGHEALKKINSQMPFDLIICDRNMPEVTANADLATVQEARAQGATAFLAKPYTPKDLEDRIHAIFGQVAESNQAR